MEPKGTHPEEAAASGAADADPMSLVDYDASSDEEDAGEPSAATPAPQPAPIRSRARPPSSSMAVGRAPRPTPPPPYDTSSGEEDAGEPSAATAPQPAPTRPRARRPSSSTAVGRAPRPAPAAAAAAAASQMTSMELIDPMVDLRHRSLSLDGQLPQALRLRTHDELWLLDQRWVPRLRAAGLLPFARLLERHRHRSARFPVDRALLSAWVDRWRPETHTFHLPVGEVTVTLQDVAMLFGLPLNGIPIGPVAVSTDWKEQLLHRFDGVLAEGEPDQFSFHDRHGPSKAWLSQFRAEKLKKEEDELRVLRHLEAYLLWLFGWVLFTSSHHDTVDRHFIYYASQIAYSPLEAVPQFSWGSAVLAATYRALCDACVRRTSTGTLAGCPLLLMLWSFERFDIGRPTLSSYDPYGDEMYVLNQFGKADKIDAPTMGTLWLSRDPTWATTGKGNYNSYVAALDLLTAGRVRWTPYTAHDIQSRAPRGLSELCYRDEELWRTRKRLVFDIFVEPHCPERVARQFGRAQVFPLPRLQLDESHGHSRKGQSIAFEQSWVDRMLSWVNAWSQAAIDVHDLGGPFDEGTYGEYLRWFHGATRVRCFPVPVEVAPREANITDTFAMEPPAAFHVLTDICSDVGNELLTYAERFEQNPQTVNRNELVATLRRLGQHCLAGVRRASFRHTTNYLSVIPINSSNAALPTPSLDLPDVASLADASRKRESNGSARHGSRSKIPRMQSQPRGIRSAAGNTLIPPQLSGRSGAPINSSNASLPTPSLDLPDVAPPADASRKRESNGSALHGSRSKVPRMQSQSRGTISAAGNTNSTTA